MRAVGLLVAGGSGDDLREHGLVTLAGANGGAREKFLLAECRIRSKALVEEVRGGQSGPPGQGSHGMTQYLISFGFHAMDHIPDEDMPAVGKAAHAVVQEAVNAGVFVFTGGLAGEKASIVATDGIVSDGPYPETKEVIGGIMVVEVPTREEALGWAAKIAVACRCAQEVREFQPGPDTAAMLREADSRRRRPGDV